MEIRPELKQVSLPQRMKKLPVDERGYPVPWFVAWVDGKPEFRAMDGRKLYRAVHERRCWVCGGKNDRDVTFVIGLMCVVNWISAEPPSHLECAQYSAQACPFLTRPHMVRRDSSLPEGIVKPAGHMVTRNPGVTALWETRYDGIDVLVEDRGYLFRFVAEPKRLRLYAEGRLATSDEIRRSLETGLPALESAACEEGLFAVAMLTRAVARARRLLDASLGCVCR